MTYSLTSAAFNKRMLLIPPCYKSGYFQIKPLRSFTVPADWRLDRLLCLRCTDSWTWRDNPERIPYQSVDPAIRRPYHRRSSVSASSRRWVRKPRTGHHLHVSSTRQSLEMATVTSCVTDFANQLQDDGLSGYSPADFQRNIVPQDFAI